MLAALGLLLALAPQEQGQEPSGLPVLRVGETIEGEITDEDAVVHAETLDAQYTDAPTVGQTYLIEVEESGPYHIDLRSYFFDAYLVLRDAEGEVMAEDDDGLVGIHSRIVAELRSGVRYRIEACALHGRRGAFTLGVSAGRVEPLSPTERDAADLLETGRRLVVNEQELGPAHPYTAWTLNRLAILHSARGDEDAALPLLERALAIRESALGPAHPDTAVSLDNLATLLGRRHEYDAARRLHERALAIRREVLGLAHPSTWASLRALDDLFHEQDDPDAARILYERALALREKHLGPDHPGTATSLHVLGALLRKQGRYDAARPLLERAVAIREEVLGDEHLLTAASLNSLAVLLCRQDDFAAARPLFERALEIREKASGPEHPETARVIANLGALLKMQGDYDAARQILERALVITEKVQGPLHPDAVTALQNLALVLAAQGDFEAARLHWQRSLSILEEVHGPKHLSIARSLHGLADLYLDQEMYDSARPLLQRALDIREELRGPEHPDTAKSLNSLAMLLQDMGGYEAAQALFERALSIREKAHGPEHPETATSMQNLASAHSARGDYEAALSLWERALAIREKAQGPEHPDTAMSLNSLAVAHLARGDYDAARPLWERALTILEQVRGREHPDTLTVLGNLAALLFYQGDNDAARPLWESALAISRMVHGPGDSHTAVILNNLALLLGDEGDHVAARSLFEQSLAIHESVHGSEHPETARVINNLALLFIDQDDHAAARPLFERALAIREDSLGREHPDIAASLGGLAIALDGQGDTLAAKSLLERALAIREKTLGPDHPVTASCLANLALMLVDLDESESAWKMLMRDEARRDARLHRILASLTEGERYRYLSGAFWRLETVISVAAGLKDPAVDLAVYEDVLNWKGRVARLLLESRERLSERLSPEQRRLVSELRACQARLSALALETDVRKLQAHGQRMAELRDLRGRLELELQRSTALPSRAKATSFAQMKAGLPEHSAVLDFLLHSTWRPATWKEDELHEPGFWREQRLSVWITGSDAPEPIRLDLGRAVAIQEAVRTFLEDMVARRGLVLGEVPSHGDRGAALRSLLWDPIAPYLEDADTVIVSPDGFLGTLPLEILPVDGGGLAIECHAFLYLQDLASLPGMGGGEGAELDSLLAAGGIDFRSRAEPPPSEGESPARARPGEALPHGSALRGGFADYWPRLPGTVLESQVVFDLHEDIHGQAGRRLLLQGAEATEERLKSELPRHEVLHLATHGFFQPEGLPSIWRAALEESQERSLLREARHLVGKHPGLLSGLVCAGANRPEEGREDGYLTAEEVGWLDLAGVEVVVLSACDTGLGRAESGEGLIGLRRAFRTAGAKTVISSLWSVKDESTADLMREFHRNLLERGMGRLEALREAQLWMLRRNRLEHGRPLPSTWGAFVLSGEWR